MKQKLKKLLSAFLAAVTLTAVFLCPAFTVSAAQKYVALTAAQRQAIADYAVDMTENPSLKRSWFDPYGGDCMSFTSNCLLAAGLTWDTESKKPWYYYDMNNRTPTWSSSTSMEEYLGTHQSGSTGLLTKRMYKGAPGSLNVAILPGDLIFFSYAGNGTFNHAAVITTGESKSSAIRFASHTAGGIKSFATWNTAKVVAIYRIVGYFPNTVPSGAFDLRPAPYSKGSNYLQISQTQKMYMGSSQGYVNKNYVITVQGYQDFSSGDKPFGFCTSMARVFNGNNSYNQSGTPYDKVVKALSYGMGDKDQTYKTVNQKLGITTLKSDEEAFYITQMGIWYGMGSLTFDGTTIKYGSYTVQSNPKNSNGARILTATLALFKVIRDGNVPVPPKKPTMTITAPSPNKAVYNTTAGAYIAGPYTVSISAGKMDSYAVAFTQNAVGAAIVDSSFKAKTTFKTGEKFYLKVPATSISVTLKVEAKTDMVRQPNIKMYTPKINGDKVQGVITGTPNTNPPPMSTVPLTTEIASLTLTKKDADTGKAVTTGGAGFQLKMGSTVVKFTGSATAGYTYNPSGTVTTITTNAATGIVVLSGLPLGSYSITETVAPTGYNLPANPTQTVTLKSGVNAVSFSDPYKTGNLTISKTDEETGALVLGSAGFTIKQGSTAIKFTGSTTAGYKVSATGTVTTVYTNPATGKATISGLKIGSYTVTEVDAPDGYDIPATRSQTLTLKEGSNTLVFKDPKTITERLTLVKKDADTGEIVLGKTGFTISQKIEPAPFKEESSSVASSETSSSVTSSDDTSSDTSSDEPGSEDNASRDSGSSNASSSTATSSDIVSSEDESDTEPQAVILTFSGDSEKGYKYDPDGKITTITTDPDTGKALIIGIPEGDYTIEETVAPALYDLPVNSKQDVHLKVGNNTVTFKDPRKTAPLTIHKTDAETGEPVLGKAGFSFAQDDEPVKFTEESTGKYKVDKKGDLTVVYTDPETGNVTISGLRVEEDYEVTEVEAPRGYNLPDKSSQVVTIKESGNTVTFADPAKYGELVIEKVNEDGKPPEGITFRVVGAHYDETHTIPEGETSVTISHLKAGEYTITETNCPVQYRTPDPSVIVIEGDDAHTVTIENRLKVGRFKIIKADKDDHEKFLPGTTFTITDEGETQMEELVTDETGVALSKELPYGEYTITEIKAPEGYVLSAEPEQTVAITEHEQVIEVTFENERIHSTIKIIKVDEDNPEVKLAGAEFGIYADEDCTDAIEVLVTGESGEIISGNLPYGNYYVREITAPVGYEKNDKVYPITVSENATVMEVVAPNKKIFGSIKIIKVDEDNQKVRLANAEFGLYTDEACTDLMQTLVTDKKGEVISGAMPYGIYFVREIKAPDGYEKNDKIYPVRISENAAVMEVVAPNRKIVGSVEILKVDKTNLDKTLSGAVFGLFSATGEKLLEKTTGADGKVVFENLPFGTYSVKELKAPKGYELADKPEAEVLISEQGQVVQLQFENSKKLTFVQTGNDTSLLTLSIILLTLALGGLLFLQRRRIAKGFKKCFRRKHDAQV